ncbi:MAG: mechanosensitive ion channel domain-containing protein [Puia sp.]
MAHKEEIEFRSRTIRTSQGLHIILPNKDIFQKPITNYSLSGERRIDVTLTLTVKTDAHRITETIRKALEQIPEIRKRKRPGYALPTIPEIRLSSKCGAGSTIRRPRALWISATKPSAGYMMHAGRKISHRGQADHPVMAANSGLKKKLFIYRFRRKINSINPKFYDIARCH